MRKADDGKKRKDTGETLEQVRAAYPRGEWSAAEARKGIPTSQALFEDGLGSGDGGD